MQFCRLVSRARARKGRNVPAKSMGSVPVGARIKWRIKATQTATKVNRNEYSTRMVGKKKLVSVKRE